MKTDLFLSYSQTNQADAFNGFSSQHAVIRRQRILHDVLEARHEAIIVMKELFLCSVGNCSNSGHYLLQNKFTATLNQLFNTKE